MPHIPIVNPARIGFAPGSLQRAHDLLQNWSDSGEVSGSALCVGRRGARAETRVFGLKPDALFLVASITKPVTALAVLMLAERGLLTLGDRVADYLPEFAQNGKSEIRLRHLLTHTSGLPDMLPDNVALRAAHAPLSAFVAGTCTQPPLFPAGTRVRYQSMGFAVLAEVVRQVAGTTLAEFLKQEVFEPLGMGDTTLGAPADWHSRVAPVQLPPEMENTDWNWNTPYWLSLGAPWGGLITTPDDFALFCRMMLGDGTFGKVRIVGPAVVRVATANQLESFPLVPEEERRCRPWGLGWRLNWPGESSNFGDFLGPGTYGHWGATGTLCWLDPDADAFCILFTTKPQEEHGRYLARISNLVAGSLV